MSLIYSIFKTLTLTFNSNCNRLGKFSSIHKNPEQLSSEYQKKKSRGNKMSSMNKTLIHEKKYLKRYHLRSTHFKSILNLTESPITINETIIVIINLRFHEKQVSTPTLTEKMLLKQFRRTVIARQLSVVDMPFSANLSRFDHPFCVNWILTITFLQEGSEVS